MAIMGYSTVDKYNKIILKYARLTLVLQFTALNGLQRDIYLFWAYSLPDSR
jgi:hypothetical protein